MKRQKTKSVWIGAHRFDYQDGNSLIAIWPHDDGKDAAWIIERTNCDDASVAVVASARERFGLVEFASLSEEERAELRAAVAANYPKEINGR